MIKKGDHVLINYGGRNVEAIVVLASPNGRSLMIAWEDGMLGGHVGMMPILQDDTGQYRSLIEGGPVGLTVVG